MSYDNILSRKFHCDHVNLGFSGNAKTEDAIVDYIKKQDMIVFVYDYDHNAPSIQHFRATHEKMFKSIRATHPDLPIVILSCPKFRLNAEEEEHRAIIEHTYRNAISYHYEPVRRRGDLG